ncbi:tyrosine recombinase XerC [Limnobacter parvus]|uniref:Tyrosine recombinase XerC n=1 Tax=Limnobacter parvus TaxID=2939690 RepID=A0ABT1XGI8_9BURK|nr:tyrosine recombinase XerC [Limnobacter parvus]MCR2746410.1 tyrosine recombinase XerC [Limnobacter parvus]
MRSTESASDNNAVLIQRYLDFLRLERRHSENSVTAVKRDLALIDAPLCAASSANLKTILAKRHAGGAAPASLARMASSWRGFFKFLHDHGHIEINPSLGLKTPKLPRALPKALGVDSLAALLQGPLPQTFRFAQAHVLIELLYCTGLRISEALSLSANVLSNASELRVIGKGNKARVVPVVDALQARFAEFSEPRLRHLSELGKVDQIALFVSAKGAPLTVRQAQRDVADHAANSGLGQHLHPHMLRHSFGSHVLQGTQNLRAVQELLGHASIASTQVYTALDFDHLSSVYDNAFPRAK